VVRGDGQANQKEEDEMSLEGEGVSRIKKLGTKKPRKEEKKWTEVRETVPCAPHWRLKARDSAANYMEGSQGFGRNRHWKRKEKGRTLGLI